MNNVTYPAQLSIEQTKEECEVNRNAVYYLLGVENGVILPQYGTEEVEMYFKDMKNSGLRLMIHDVRKNNLDGYAVELNHGSPIYKEVVKREKMDDGR